MPRQPHARLGEFVAELGIILLFPGHVKRWTVQLARFELNLSHASTQPPVCFAFNPNTRKHVMVKFSSYSLGIHIALMWFSF